MTRQRIITALDAVEATTTSEKYFVGDAKRVGLMFRRADHTSGSTAFTVKASLEGYVNGNGTTALDIRDNKKGGAGVTMTALNMLVDNVTNTNAQTRTRVNGKTLSAAGDAFLWLEPDFLVNWLEITATETTDGTHSAWIVIEEEDGTGIFN